MPHPFANENNPLEVATRRTFTIPPDKTLHTLGYIRGSKDRPLDDVRVGEQGLLRPALPKPVEGLTSLNHLVEVYSLKRVRIALTNATDKPITVPANTVVSIYTTDPSINIVDFQDVHDENPTLPRDEFLKHLQQSKLEPKLIEHMLNIIFERRKAFAMHPSKPGLNRLIVHRIDTGDHRPIALRPHNHSPAEGSDIAPGGRAMGWYGT